MEAKYHDLPADGYPLIIDTHAHVSMDAFSKDRKDVIERARRAKVAFIEVGFDIDSSKRSLALASQVGTYCSVGIHPHEAESEGKFQHSWKEIEALLASGRVKAIGEIGLDYFRKFSSKKAQIDTFMLGLDLARRTKLPVIVHQRDAREDVLRVLRGARHDLPVIFHCYSYDVDYARRCLDLNGYLGFGGPVTYPRNDHLRDLLKYLPLDRILVETDCPYLPPQSKRGHRNEPVFVVEVVAAIAEVLGRKVVDVARITRENALRAFNIDDESLKMPYAEKR